MRNKILLCFIVWLGILAVNGGFSFSEEIRYQSGERRDPFVPIKTSGVIAAQVDDMPFILEGIIYDRQGASVVVVHGEPHKVGDEIDGLKVVSIYPSRVELEDKSGKKIEYWVSETEKQLLVTE